MDQATQVRQLWHMVYDMLRGPGRTQTYDSYEALAPDFEEGLLNDIARLGQASGADKTTLIEQIRAQIGICQSTGFLGEADRLQLEAELDKI